MNGYPGEGNDARSRTGMKAETGFSGDAPPPRRFIVDPDSDPLETFNLNSSPSSLMEPSAYAGLLATHWRNDASSLPTQFTTVRARNIPARALVAANFRIINTAISNVENLREEDGTMSYERENAEVQQIPRLERANCFTDKATRLASRVASKLSESESGQLKNLEPAKAACQGHNTAFSVSSFALDVLKKA